MLMMIKRSNKSYSERKSYGGASSYARLNKMAKYFAVVFIVAVVSVFAVGGVVSYAQPGDGSQTEYTGDTGDGIKVTAKADAGTFPEGTTLKVTRVTKDGDTSADYAAAKSALDESGTTYDDFAAVDISFVDSNGNEVEPADGKAVSVVLTADDSVVPEDADPSTLAVSHIDESGSQSQATAVADSGTETEGSVDASEGTVKAEFTTDSFSTYTITWKSSGVFSHTHFIVTVHYVDESGSDIDVSDATDVTETSFWGTNAVYTFSQGAKNIDGYSYDHASYDTYRGSVVTSATYEQTKPQGSYGKITFYNQDTQVAQLSSTGGATQYADVYLVYTDNSSLKITDNVKADGTFVANYSGTLEDGQYYRWVRSTSQDGTYSTVESKRVSGKSYNVDPSDTSKINVVLDGHDDESQHYWYKLQIVNADGKVAAESHPKQNTYNYQLRNGGFETPAVTSGYNHQYSNDDYLDNGGYWQTTGTGTGDKAGRDIEIVNPSNDPSGCQYQFHTYDAKYNGQMAPEGSQFAELNCEASGSLYQDVMTIPGSQLTYSLFHRARGIVHGYNRDNASNYRDTMYVLIMSAELADKLNIKTQTDVNNAITQINAGNPDYAGAKVFSYTDPMVWTLHNGDYTVPSGQYLTRFFFVAGDTASNNDTIGNLIDGVSFSSKIPDPVNGGNLEVSKTVSGLTDDEMNNYSVTVTVTGTDSAGNFVSLSHEFSDFVQQSDGSYEQTYTFLELDPGTYKVTETDKSGDLSAYDLTSTVNGSSDTSTSVSVVAKQTAHADFTNTYSKKPVNLTISKKVTGNMGDKSQEFGFTLKTNGDAGDLTDAVTTDGNITVTKNEDGTYSFSLTHGQAVTVSLPYGTTYTVTENNPNKSGDSLNYTTTYKVGDQTGTGTTYTATSGLTSDTTVAFTNDKTMSSPDVGVNIGSSLPYAVGLGSVTAGAAFLLAKRRRGIER